MHYPRALAPTNRTCLSPPFLTQIYSSPMTEAQESGFKVALALTKAK